MTTLDELVHYLDDKLHVSKIEDFGPNGLQVEGTKGPIKVVATGVSASLKTIEAAIKEKAQVLIVHHGMFWNKDSMRVVRSVKKKLKLLLDHDISLLAYHLPLDCHPEFGNNWRAAKDLGWSNLKPFGPTQGQFTLGVQGTFAEESVEDFTQRLEKYYGHKAHTAIGNPSTVKSGAIISGGAHREIHKAIDAGVDCYITGSFDEPIWNIAHEEKINFFAMGHANTEEVGPNALGEHLAKKFSIQHKFLNIPNPF